MNTIIVTARFMIFMHIIILFWVIVKGDVGNELLLLGYLDVFFYPAFIIGSFIYLWKSKNSDTLFKKARTHIVISIPIIISIMFLISKIF